MISQIITQTCSLLKARSWFKVREALNWALTIILFVPTFFLLMITLGAGIAFILSTAAAFCLFFFVLDKRAIKILCNHCGNTIITNVPWMYGFCQKLNTNTDDFPFIHRCEHCGAEPRAYKCHHCEKLIFLSEDQLTTSYARYVHATVVKNRPTVNNINPHERVKRKLKDKLEIAQLTNELAEITQRGPEKRDLEQQVLKARLTNELKAESQKGESLTKKTAKDKAEESFSRNHDARMAAIDIARREKAANAVKYKDDPYLLERADDSVDAWLKDQM